jgi:high affinity Mn2+ porin
MQDSRRLTLTAGRFGVADLFDDNAFSHDPRTQFLNWALMSAGAWDYPADTRGYTWGLAADYTVEGVWSLRAAAVLVPKQANGLEMDTEVKQAEGLVAESEWHYSLGPRRGAARALVFLNRARMGNYDQAIAAAAGTEPDITSTRRAGRTKYGLAVNAEQAITPELGAFIRLSWNDGKNETWAFTEIDHSAAVGVVERGTPWLRPDDELGLALIAQGISTPHRRYLAAGGLGFIIGDGALDYGAEGVLEAYYRLALTRLVAFSPDYQFVLHPGYNTARGPVHVFGLRMHVEL